ITRRASSSGSGSRRRPASRRADRSCADLVAGEGCRNRACALGLFSFTTGTGASIDGRPDRPDEHPLMAGRHLCMEIFMKTIVAMLFSAVLALPPAPAQATVLDLSTMTCKQFVEGGEDEIKMVQ